MSGSSGTGNDGDRSPRVAVIGARGIGKHHAKWWDLCGADVCAIAGTSAATLEVAESALRELFDFTGKSHTDVAGMLAAESPDFVDVCSSTEMHAEHVRLALDADADVLCEKPFVFDAERDAASLMSDANELVSLAERSGRCLAPCLQYAVVAETCREAHVAALPDEEIRELEAEVGSPAKDRPPDPEPIWADLGPHVLSMVQALAPNGELDRDTLSVDFSPDHARCAFVIAQDEAPNLSCRLHTFRTREDPANVRRLTLNGNAYELLGHRGDDGVYRAKYETPWGTRIGDDPMHVIIQRMLGGSPVMDAGAAVRNQDWLLTVLGA